MPLPKFLNYFKSKKKTINISSPNQDQYFNSNIYETSTYKHFESDLDYLKIFNYNPEKESVSSYMERVLKTTLSRGDLDKIKNMQKDFFSLKKKYNNLEDGEEKVNIAEEITKLGNYLKLKIIKIMEGVKITFEGFDIREHSIPKELLENSSDIAINFMLNVIRAGYLDKQIISLFGLTSGQYKAISEKDKIKRTEKEQRIYQNILETIGAVLSLINDKKDKKDKYDILQKLKSIKPEGKKIYNLFLPLI